MSHSWDFLPFYVIFTTTHIHGRVPKILMKMGTRPPQNFMIPVLQALNLGYRCQYGRHSVAILYKRKISIVWGSPWLAPIRKPQKQYTLYKQITHDVVGVLPVPPCTVSPRTLGTSYIVYTRTTSFLLSILFLLL